jgi:hypothetical protein
VNTNALPPSDCHSSSLKYLVENSLPQLIRDGEMFPLRCLSVLLLLSFVLIHCETTETLIEMKGDKLKDEETTEMEHFEEENGERGGKKG